jgi:dTDP-4-dehydrorhamnose 3,5-epimerase
MHAIPTARAVLSDNIPLPDGVKLHSLRPHSDDRGCFTELFRSEWRLGPDPVQWNMVRSAPNVLRGVHAHRRHVDFITMAAGEMVLCLHDLRPNSGTHRCSAMFRLQADDLHLAVVPAGVAHGFYFPEPACHVYSVTEYFNSGDELACHWHDPALGFDWPCTDPLLSERDRAAGSYSEMVSALGFQV